MLRLWVLDDQYAGTISELLQEDGWRFKFRGSSYGLEINEFRALWTLKDKLNRIKEPRDLPFAALLDVDLGPNCGGEYGGFAAWRAIEDKAQEMSQTLGRIPLAMRTKTIMYTRKPDLVPLANYLSKPPANPAILPFAGRRPVEALRDAGKYQFTDHLDKKIRDLRRLWIQDHTIDATELARQIGEASVDGVLKLKLGQIPVASLFPREVQKIASDVKGSSRDRLSIMSELRGCHHDFRTAFYGLVWFLTKGTLPIRTVERHRPDGKINHWFSQGPEKKLSEKTERSDAQKVVKKAIKDWGPALGDPLYHLPENVPGSFIKSPFWETLQVITQVTPTSWKPFRDLSKLCRETLCYEKIGKKSPELLRKAREVEPYKQETGWERLFLDLSAFEGDIRLIESALSDHRSGTYADCITRKNLAERTEVCRKEAWVGGNRSVSLSFVVRIGRIEPTISNWTGRILEAARKDFDPGSLSALRYIICNIYRGQLCILETRRDGKGIARGVIALGSQQARPMTDRERTELTRDWESLLNKPGYVFNIITFEPVKGETE